MTAPQGRAELRNWPESAPVALVTGGNRGIGYEVARQLRDLGYAVVLGARDPKKGTEAARRLTGSGGDGPDVVGLQLDVTDQVSVDGVVKWLDDGPGRLDLLVNNAAINYDTNQSALGVDLEFVRETLDTNLFGAWRMTQACLSLLARSPHGRIVNVSSEAGSLAGISGGGTPAYSVSKAGLNALTRMVAGQLRGQKVLVNAVCPGWTDTDMGAGGRPVSEGAGSVIWAATLPDDGPTGGFFRDGRPLPW